MSLGLCSVLLGCSHVSGPATVDAHPVSPSYLFSASIFADFMPGDLPEYPETLGRIRKITLQLEAPSSVASLSSLIVSPVSCEIYVDGVLKETIIAFSKEDSVFVADGNFDYLSAIADIYDGSGHKIASHSVTVAFHCLINDISYTFSTTPTIDIVE